jgi:flagellar motility protein MotE (MotC chaperone)
MRSSNKTLADALRILAQDIESPDGVANAAILEAAQRIEELAERVKRLEETGDAMAKWLDRNTPVTVRFDWSAAKEDKL